MNPTFGLHPEQYAATATVLARAFREDPVVVAILKGFAPEARIRMLEILYQANLEKTQVAKASLLMADDSAKAAALVHAPGLFPLPLRVQLALMWRGIVTVKSPGVMKRWLNWQLAIEKQHAKPQHYYIEFIGVDPAHQGQGLGSRMLRDITLRADREHVGCYLETGNPKNLPLYQRYGFETTAEQTINAVHTWFMWRPQR